MTVMDPGTMQPVPRDGETMGEIMFRGNITMKGYLKNASATYGIFALVLGLLAWLQLAASMTLLSAELNVVAARHLWPRSLTLLVEEPRATGDEDALRQRAEIETRRSDQDVQVVFDDAGDDRA